MYTSYNKTFHQEVTTIFPGELYVSKTQEIISTVLGSCIAVCLYDKTTKTGGMNHFMLPESKIKDLNIKELLKSPAAIVSSELRYGTVSMEILIGEMQKIGASRSRLRAKIFGGGNVLNTGSDSKMKIGDKNALFAREYLKLENIPIDSEDTGDRYGRKIFFITSENRILLKKVDTVAPINIPKEEKKYNQTIEKKTQAPGSIDLF